MTQLEKIIIYQVFPRWFGNLNSSLVRDGSIKENGVGKFSDFTAKALSGIKALGITHIWYTGIIEHATKTDYTAYGIPLDHPTVVKGNAGSPYAIKDYYDVDPDLANDVRKRMKEFSSLVRRTHEAGMKVIIDFVPNHVARCYKSDARMPYMKDLGAEDNTYKAFDRNNNFYYLPNQSLSLNFGMTGAECPDYSEFPAKATGNDCFSAYPNANDWYETIKLNYGVDYKGGRSSHFNPIPNTWTKMLDILTFWVGQGVDGFRCDMAEMVPVEFWQWVIPQVKKAHDICFIAEVYNPSEYNNYITKGHFDYLYDKVGLYDTLRAVVSMRAPAYSISACRRSVENIQGQMLHFMENHDEQRIASDFFAKNARKGIPAMIVSAAMWTNPVMVYSGQELGERGMEEEGFSGLDGRTTIFDYWSLESLRNWNNNGAFDEAKLSEEQRWLRSVYVRLLNVCRTEPAIVKGAFYDLMYANADNPCFNTNSQYVFLRKYEDDVLLIAVNFDETEQTIKIRIPADAFRTLGFGDNKPAYLTDLLTGEQSVSTLTTACPYQVTLRPFSGGMMRFRYNQ